MSLHIGVTPWNMQVLTDAKALSKQAIHAESLGYQSFWLPENHFTEGIAIPDPLMLLASVAATTSKIRLATTSYLLPLRHPLQAAEQVAVLDQISGGRVILGVGRGFQPAMFAAFDVPLRDKRPLFAECLQRMQAAWSGDAVAHNEQGDAITLSPQPVQRPHPPIWVAAFGPKALAQAGKLGLPYLASPMESLQTLRNNYQVHANACECEGAAIPKEIPVMRSVFVSRNINKVKAAAKFLANQKPVTRLKTEVTSGINNGALIGEPSAVADALQRYSEELGITHLIATSLRVGGVGDEDRQTSVELFAEATAK